MEKIIKTYDTATVCQILSEAAGHPLSSGVIRNMSRDGNALHDAVIRRGSFNPRMVENVARKMVRRRLAARLGRISPRFLDASHSRTCSQCEAVAVEWGGQVTCQEGHTSIESVDPGSPGGDHAAYALIASDGTVLDDSDRLEDLADHG